MTDAEPMALRQDLGDAPAMAHPPIGLVAQQAARRRFGYLCSPIKVALGLGAGELLLNDLPETFPSAAPIGKAALRRCPEPRQMNIMHTGVLDRRRELTLREAGPARNWPVAHIEQCHHTSCG